MRPSFYYRGFRHGHIIFILFLFACNIPIDYGRYWDWISLKIFNLYSNVRRVWFNDSNSVMCSSHTVNSLPATPVTPLSSDGVKGKLNPWFVTGFVDAEGCFSMSVLRRKSAAIGWTIQPSFIITLHLRDIELLNKIQLFFGVGQVALTGKNFAVYRVRSREDLKVIIAHFVTYPLHTLKAIHFLRFCRILDLMNYGWHTNVECFLKLLSLINKLNNPLSESLREKVANLGVIPKENWDDVIYPLMPSFNQILDPWWIAGFVTGEGCFTYNSSKRVKAGVVTATIYSPMFEVSQRVDSIHVLDWIVNYWGAGKVYTEKRGISKVRISRLEVITNFVTPFFNSYHLEGYKAIQYSIWLKIVMLKNQGPLTAERIKEIATLIEELSNLKNKK